jgi:hypothetical protein
MSNPHTTTGARQGPGRALGRIVLGTGFVGSVVGLLVLARTAINEPELSSPASEQSETRIPESEIAAVQSPPSLVAQAARGSDHLIDDDGATLWMAPTDGRSLDLAYLPPGAQVIANVRAKALAEHPEGEKIRAALGPLGEKATKYVEAAARVKWPEVDELLVGIQTTSDGGWQPTLVLRLGDAASQRAQSDLVGATQNQHGGESYWTVDDLAYYWPSRQKGRTLVVSPAATIADIIDLGGQPPPLRRDLERLLARTDAERQVTILFAPNSLFSEGRRMFEGDLSALRDALFWFLGDELSAAALSLHWSEDFFVELAATPTLDTTPERTARILSERVAQVPAELKRFVNELHTAPYGREVVGRLPAMVEQLAKFTRSGFEPDQALLRCYLPVVAGHNLLLGAELALAEVTPGGTVADFGELSRVEATAPSGFQIGETVSVRARLRRVTSLRFGRDTLEAALEQLGRDIGILIAIRGADLQAEGITKNQSFGIDLENKPAEEILVAILTLANPDKSASAPSDERQKLVYVILLAGPDGAEQVVVTTRAAAAQRGDELPGVFTNKRP